MDSCSAGARRPHVGVGEAGRGTSFWDVVSHYTREARNVVNLTGSPVLTAVYLPSLGCKFFERRDLFIYCYILSIYSSYWLILGTQNERRT